MLDICLLGTGGMMPLPDRYLTSMILRYNGKKLLVDCGEGTQVTMKLLGWGYKTLDVLCITHFHGDHVTGLPGLLLTLGNSGREEPLTIVGPIGLKKVVEGLTIVCRDINFKLNLIEVPVEEQILKMGDFFITTIPAKHNVPCLGYSIEIKRQPKFILEKAKENNIPKQFWKILQNGDSIEGYSPEMVLGEYRKGLKVSYVTDSRPSAEISNLIKGSDLFICEGMYLQNEYKEQVRKYKHMLGTEGAKMAKQSNCKELWLTHFSPAIPNSELDIKEVKEIFENSFLGFDRKMKILNFED
ncbi:ribonuclease Z [Candidatus Epulonipiscium fishelsonii]|uniref:Ribonuclease Z n=1 Tax=Candidatus Epulonipiscium fishelsonii TaxID=77094 RepID=A0ACC8XIF2_9FIRM|nr:ribonuclease Z [Epulopiscium sp. SCG-D08WGA-EpuloA1]OON95010.1 MAG: ribonuclease Z [Epulopiscium sp. AS2M-Bin002]